MPNNTNLIMPSDDRVLRVIGRITELTYALNVYTFAIIQIPGLVDYLKEIANVTKKESGKIFNFSEGQYGTGLGLDYNRDWSSPYYISDNDIVMFAPYSLDQTNISIDDMPNDNINSEIGPISYFDHIRTAGYLTVSYYEFMYPVVTKLHSLWYSIFNSVQTNSFLKFKAGIPPKIPYGYITLVMAVPDLSHIPVAISFLNCFPTKDIIQNLLSMQVGSAQLVQLQVEYKFQTYRRYFLDDNLFNLRDPYNGFGDYVYNIFAKIATMPNDEWQNILNNTYNSLTNTPAAQAGLPPFFTGTVTTITQYFGQQNTTTNTNTTNTNSTQTTNNSQQVYPAGSNNTYNDWTPTDGFNGIGFT